MLCHCRSAAACFSRQGPAAALGVPVTGVHDDASIDHASTFRTSHLHAPILSSETPVLLAFTTRTTVGGAREHTKDGTPYSGAHFTPDLLAGNHPFESDAYEQVPMRRKNARELGENRRY